MFKQSIQALYPLSRTRVIVLGHQKSGTSAIASLLSEYTRLNLSSDPLHQIDQGMANTVEKLFCGDMTVKDVYQKHPKQMSQPIIKEPDFIYFVDDLLKLYLRAKFVFIIRDPRDTIRSICNRLDIVAPQYDLYRTTADMIDSNRHWRLILSGKLAKPGETIDYGSILKNLAFRWNHTCNTYMSHKDNIKLVRYEDFLTDKETYIENVARDLKLKGKASIGHRVNVQFQPKGEPKRPLHEIFGKNGLDCIESICGQNMAQFGYEPSSK